MTRNRMLVVVVVVFVSLASFLAGMHFAPGSSVQAQRSLQMYKVMKLDAATTPLILADQMNDYAQVGYRFRDSHEGLIIMEYAGK
ncbi:MAG TPA: hypothetical protein VFC63_15875 [Blastocatellia bacterium]|nr:hypothetical protein [Blastocatellia bacterium]